jgi:uncharacterized protein (TIGR03083 family)
MTEGLDHLAAVQREGSRFSAVLAGADLALAVPGCPDWTLADLCVHLGRVHRWAAANASGGGERGTRPGDPEPGTDLRRWYADGLADLLRVLADAEEPAWTFVGPATVAWWQRRMALEALVHRVDAEAAAGVRTALDPVLAADGVAEVVEVLRPARAAATGGAALPAELVLATDDGSGRWRLPGPPPGGSVTGPADALLLLVWGRTTLDDPALRVEGRDRAAEVLAAGLTP